MIQFFNKPTQSHHLHLKTRFILGFCPLGFDNVNIFRNFQSLLFQCVPSPYNPHSEEVIR